MLTAKTTELELMQGWFDSDPDHARVRVAFPINRWAGSRDSAVVYFEVKPGDRLARHTDSAEEVLYIVAGEAEAEVGDQRGRLAKGVNVGAETVKVVGFFSESEVISTFKEPVQPFGASVLNQGAPPPA